MAGSFGPSPEFEKDELINYEYMTTVLFESDLIALFVLTFMVFTF